MSIREKSLRSEAQVEISPCAWNCPFLLHLPRKRASQKLRRCGHLDRSLKLSTRGIDISPPRMPYKRRNPRLTQNFLERLDPLRARRLKFNSRARIQRNQIHLAAHPAQQLSYFSCVLWLRIP